MRITVKEIQQRSQTIWPELRNIWCFDKVYALPYSSDVITSFNDGLWFDVDNMKRSDADCDDFALQQHAKVKLEFDWAFGEVFCSKVNSWEVMHNLNICFCTDSILMVDAESKEIWNANANDDNVLWMRL